MSAMAGNITLTKEQSDALEAFCDAFDMCTTGQWTAIAAHMKNECGIEDPEVSLENAREALRG